MRCTARYNCIPRLFTVTAESFSEKKGFPRAKWRAVAMGGTGIRKQRPSALAEPPGCCTRPIAMENAAAVQQQLPLQRGAESSARNPAAAKCVEGRGDARFVLAELAWCHRQAREHLSMHARMNTSCTIRHGRHARLMCLQAAARQWSSHKMEIYGCTSRGKLHMVVLHAVVQWFASVCCMCRPRAIARSTTHNAFAARVVRG